MRTAGGLELDDVLRRRPLRALHDFKLHALSFGQRLEALRLDRGVMHEAVLFAVLRRDETEHLRALPDFKLHALSFGQRLEALRLDRGVMHEAVLFAVLRRDETEPLRVIEPLHGTGDTCHNW